MSDQTDWTGTQAVQQSQVALASNFTLSAPAGTTVSSTFAIPAGVHINSLALLGLNTGNVAAVVRVEGVTSGFPYYEGRPFANDGNLLYPKAIEPRAICAFPGDYEGSARVTVTSTGSAAGIQFGYLIGFEGTTPPFLPPVAVPNLATQGIVNQTLSVLPDLTDGRFYRIWSAMVQNTGAASAAVSLNLGQLITGTMLLAAYTANQATTESYPNGLILPGNKGLNLNGPGTGTCTVSYDYV